MKGRRCPSESDPVPVGARADEPAVSFRAACLILGMMNKSLHGWKPNGERSWSNHMNEHVDLGEKGTKREGNGGDTCRSREERKKRWIPRRRSDPAEEIRQIPEVAARASSPGAGGGGGWEKRRRVGARARPSPRPSIYRPPDVSDVRQVSDVRSGFSRRTTDTGRTSGMSLAAGRSRHVGRPRE